MYGSLAKHITCTSGRIFIISQATNRPIMSKNMHFYHFQSMKDRTALFLCSCIYSLFCVGKSTTENLSINSHFCECMIKISYWNGEKRKESSKFHEFKNKCNTTFRSWCYTLNQQQVDFSIIFFIHFFEGASIVQQEKTKKKNYTCLWSA